MYVCRYSVRLSGGSGQVALSYGSQAGADMDRDGVKLEQADGPGAASVDLTYGAGLDMDGRYATANGAQPRALPLDDSKKKSRRRRSASAGDDDNLNEIDGPVPVNDVQPANKKQPSEATTTAPEETTTTMDVVTIVQGDKKDADNKVGFEDKVPVTDSVTTDIVITNPSVIVTTMLSDNDLGESSSDVSADSDLRNTYGAAPSSNIVSTSTITSTIPSTSTKPPTTTAESPANSTDDPLSTLFNMFRRVAEFKLRVGMNLLRGTSEAVTRYIGGVTKRMEEAAEHLHTMRNKKRAAPTPTTPEPASSTTASGQTRLRRRTRDVSKSKHQLKKMITRAQMTKKKQH